MKIIGMSGYHLGVDCKDAYFIQPESEEEKNLLKELIEKIKKECPKEEMCEESYP